MFNRDAYFAELAEYYAAYPRSIQDSDLSEIEAEWKHRTDAEPDCSPYRMKALLYDTIGDMCDVHVFRHSPFYYEILSGRPRNNWGMAGVGLLMRDLHWDESNAIGSFVRPFEQEENLFNAHWFMDWDHHCVGYDNVLALGLLGLRQRAKSRLSEESDPLKREFLASTISALDCLIGLSAKFADRAREMLAKESDPGVRKNLSRIADTAGRVPAEPAKTFYEALNTIFFMREACTSMEGIAISVFGQVDRMLEPYYEADLREGRITREEAYDLLKAFIAYTDARFERTALHETSTTVNIGGQDRDGRPIYNDITRMICDAFRELGIVGTKLNARICRDHSREYYDLLAEMALSGTNVLAVFNDEALVPAHVNRGKSLEDSRLYVNGGCQEPVLQNTEVNFRANIYMNVVKPLELTLFPEKITARDREHFDLSAAGPSCGTFDDFYRTFMKNIKSIFDGIGAMAASYAPGMWRMNPCPMTSATISDCIEKGLDMLQGGARYNTSSISLNGLGTLIDAFYSVKHLVYDTGMLNMDDLRRMLETDYEGWEDTRRYILREVPKYGQDHDDVNDFASKLVGDIADAASGQDNGRGGTFEASLFTYGAHRQWGERSPATPDGRRAGEWFTRGMSPREGDAAKGLTAVINSACALPMDKYPGGGVLDITLPAGMGMRTDILSAVIKRFVEGGGSILQLNSIDKEILTDAKRFPEKHPALVVRVWGFSAYFTTLPEGIQDEIIARTVQST